MMRKISVVSLTLCFLVIFFLKKKLFYFWATLFSTFKHFVVYFLFLTCITLFTFYHFETKMGSNFYFWYKFVCFFCF